MMRKISTISIILLVCLSTSSIPATVVTDQDNIDRINTFQARTSAGRGWSLQWTHAYGGNGHAQMAQPVGDIDDDGINEIILGGYETSGICRIYSYDSGLETYIEEYSWTVPGGSYHSPSGAAVVDLDEDGDLEFCVSWGYSSADGVYAYEWDGTTLTQLDWYYGTGVDFVFDIYACDYDDDTHPEILIANAPNMGSGDKHVTALGWDTDHFVMETSWSCPGGSSMECPMVWSGDVDNDGKTEVIADVSVGTSATAGTWALNWNDVTEIWEGVPVCTNYGGSTVYGDGVGDIDGDGTPEIGIGSYGGTPSGWLFEWDGSTFQQVWHAQYPSGEPVIEAIAIGDADNDGQNEFCIGAGYVHVIGWDGSTYVEEAVLTEPTGMLAGLIIGDCDSDTHNEIKACEILSGTGSEFIWTFADLTPPVTTCHLNGTMNGSIYVSDVTVSFTVVDESPIIGTYYSFDNVSFQLYTTPFIVTDDGTHTLYFYSVDSPGNIENTKSCTFTIQHPVIIDITDIKGGIGVTATFTNTGTETYEHIPWSITVNGGFILGANTTSGTILQLQPGATTTKHLIVLGIGKITIMVTAATAGKNATGFVLLVFVVGVT
ncbi:MAG: VCBS repeat-containing protein [Candidatus Thermoplasmatota archaeon]|nr:VCBS repeat-containing protein [Candidatus Thermoplasmatota archaeon]